MKKLTKKETVEFEKHLSVLCEETGADVDYLQVKRTLTALVTIEASLQRLNVFECNYGLSSRQEKRRENLENEAIELIKKLGLKGDTQRDPRGWSILIYLPSKKFNSWDGESYRIGIYE